MQIYQKLIRAVGFIILAMTFSAAASAVSLHVNSPSQNYNGSAPVNVSANASSSYPITGWQVYIDGNSTYSAGRVSSINANVNVSTGNHQIVIRAWDSTGAYGDFYGTLSITNGNNGLPTPPSWATYINQIQNRGSWNWCHDPGCAGGSGRGTYWMAQHQGNPSRTGSSMEIFNSGVWANALWWNKFGAQDSASNFLWDFWVYLDGNFTGAAQSLEYDMFQFVNGYNYMMGTQCVVPAGVWDTWDEAGGHWIHSPVHCPRFSPNTWHHIQMYVTTNTRTHQYTYHTLVVDGQSFTLNITHYAKYLAWSHNIGAQWQLDVNSSGTGFHEWVDNAKMWYW